MCDKWLLFSIKIIKTTVEISLLVRLFCVIPALLCLFMSNVSLCSVQYDRGLFDL